MRNRILIGLCTLLFLIIHTPIWSNESSGYDIIVDRNGRGDYRNLQEAIESIRAFKPEGRTTILIRNGIYKEKIIIPTHVCNVKLIGESKENTFITYDDHANINNMGTFKSFSFLIRGNDIILENLTFENSSLPLGQAVALHIEGDRIVLKNCNVLGNQDTIYAGRESSRVFFLNCYIEGTTDFVFGPSTCWFENCEIHCKKNSYITAASTPKNIDFGFIFNRCKITCDPSVNKVYLGRPWRAYAMTLFMNSNLPKEIRVEGWHNWNNEDNEKTARYIEYNNTGEGANISKRVPWIQLITKKTISKYTIEETMKGCDNWNPLLIK